MCQRCVDRQNKAKAGFSQKANVDYTVYNQEDNKQKSKPENNRPIISTNNIIVLILLTIVGVFFYKKKDKVLSLLEEYKNKL